MLNDLADALEICLSHANESPALIHKRITGFTGLDEKVRDQLLRRMVVERFKFLRSEKSTKSVESQLEDFAPFLHLPDDDPKMQKLLRRLVTIDIATSRAAIDRDEMKDIYPGHGKWIDQCLKKHKTLTYVRWLEGKTEDELRRKRSDEIVLSDEYVIEKHIGRGGLKDVYQVIQKSTGQIIAFKELHPQAFSNASHQDALRREAMLQAKLQHQGVPSVFTLNNRDADNLVFLEHHINGKPWSELIDEMSLGENLRVLLRTANIVAFAHKECKIIHADLKPENVMIEKDYGEIYLVDWGHAIDMESDKKDVDDEPISGTQEYMSPESSSPRNQATTALDVFLLGGILYRSLTGKPPFPKFQDAASKEITLPDRTPSGETIPSDLVGLVLKALDRDPKKRFADASEFAQALERYIRRSEALKHYAITEQRYQNALDQLSNHKNDSSFLSKHTIELIEIANEFRFIKENLQGFGDDSDPALIEASRSEKKARLSLVDTAIALGDFGMAEGQLNLAETLADPLSTRAGIPKRRQQIKDGVAKRQRDRRMRTIAASLGVLVLLGMMGTLFQSRRVAQEQRKNAEQALENRRLRVDPLLQKEQLAGKQRFEQGGLVFLANALTFDDKDEKNHHRFFQSRLQSSVPSPIRLFDPNAPPADLVEQDKVNLTQAVVLPMKDELVFASWDGDDVLQSVSFETGMITGRYGFENTKGNALFSLAISPDGSRIAGILENGDLVVWKTGETVPYKTVRKAIKPVRRTKDSKEGGLSFRSDNNRLVFMDAETGGISFSNIEGDDKIERFSPKIPEELKDQHFVPNAVHFASDGNQLFVLLEDKKEPPFYVLSWWDIETGRCIRFLPCWQSDAFDNRSGDMLREVLGATVAHAVSRDGEYFLFTNFFGDLCLVDLEQQQVVWQRVTPGDVLENYSTWSMVQNAADPKEFEKVVKTERSIPPAVANLAFSPDGNHFVATYHNGIVRVCDTQTGDPVGTFAGLPQELLLRKVLSPEGLPAELKMEDFLAPVSYLHAVCPIQRFRPFLSNDDRLAVLGSDGYLRFWNPLDVKRTERELTIQKKSLDGIPPKEQAVYKLLYDQSKVGPGGFLVRVAPINDEFSILSEGTFYLGDSNNGQIRHWKNAENGSTVSEMDLSYLDVLDAAYFIDGKGILKLIVSSDGRLVQVDAATGTEDAEFEPIQEAEGKQPHDFSPTMQYAEPSAAFAEDSTAGGQPDSSSKKKKGPKKPFFERFFTSKVRERNKKLLVLSQTPLACLAVSSSCSKVAARGDGGEIVFWDLTSKKRIASLVASKRPIWSLAFREDGKRLAALDSDGCLLLIDTTGQPTLMTTKDQETLLPPWRTPHGLLFLPGGKLLQYGLNGTLLIWDAETGQIVQRLETNLSYTDIPEFESAAISQDGLMLFAGNNDGLIYCWTRKTPDDSFAIKTIFRVVPPKSMFRQSNADMSVQGLGVLSNGRELVVTTADRRFVIDLELIMKDAALDAETRCRQIEAQTGLKLGENGFLVPNPPLEVRQLQEVPDDKKLDGKPPASTEQATSPEKSPIIAGEKPKEAKIESPEAVSTQCPNEAKLAEIEEKRIKAAEEMKQGFPADADSSAPLLDQLRVSQKNLAAIEAATARWQKIDNELFAQYEVLIQDCVEKNCPNKDEHLDVLKKEKEMRDFLKQLQEEDENDGF